MDIQVVVQDHKNSNYAKSYFEEEIGKAFAPYSFITTIIFRDERGDGSGLIKCSLEMHLKSAPPVFVKEVDADEDRSFRTVLKKAKRKLEKYKAGHYRSSAFK